LKPEKDPLESVVHFFFELGMLKKTPRSGFQFLGSGGESVAEHSFRTALIGYALARLSGDADPRRVACLCLFHDVPEARTGDLNYVNKQYVRADEVKAVEDAAALLPFGDDYRDFHEEYRKGETPAARLAHDADQLDLILELKEQNDLGNAYARRWIHFARRRLGTDIGRRAAAAVLSTDSAAWWLDGNDHWWSKGGGQ